VELGLPTAGLERYKNPTQRIRVSSEAWGESNLYCANCDSSELLRTPTNTPAIDFTCPQCDERFQLKSQKKKLGKTLTDGSYSKMREAIEEDRTPHLLALHYHSEEWNVRTLILIPRFSYTLSVIKKRNPLNPGAERHGWVGCSILLGEIPPEAKISLVADGNVRARSEVREEFSKLRELGKMTVAARGWTLDVLRVVHSLNKTEFTAGEVYDYESDLRILHPNNRNIQPKIRQQLQELRDMGVLEFVSRGRYRLLSRHDE